MQAYGLGTHISSNNFKSVLLLAGFPVLLMLLMYALFLLYAGVSGDFGQYGNGVESPFRWAADALVHAWPFAIGGAAVWFVIAFLSSAVTKGMPLRTRTRSIECAGCLGS